MAVPGQAKPPREYNHGDVIISLENCILQEDKLSETPSMKDGLDRETESNLRIFACELIQTSGILLKLPQVAMATGQVLLQRFYYSKSFVKHDFEIYAMACIFLAAKIEEAPRRLRDVVNVFHHIKQKRSGRPITPMDCLGNTYVSLKNQVIKAERRVLKELGFCVHVKHPHKIIITYLQILECEKNVDLAQKAWNYMNDCLRTDVFVKFAPEKIACACIFLASRMQQIPLPANPPWWELFGSRIEEVEEIAVTMLGIYARPKISRSRLELAVEKAKKLIQDKKDATKDTAVVAGSFTPAHISPANAANSLLPSSKPGSPAKVSPADSTSTQPVKPRTEKIPPSSSRSYLKHSETRKRIEQDRNALGIRPTKEDKRQFKGRPRSVSPPKRRRPKSESETSSDADSDSGSSSAEDDDKDAHDESSNDETSSSSLSDEKTKVKRRKQEPNHTRRIIRTESSKDRFRFRKDIASENGHKTYQYDYNKRIRSRSPFQRSKSRSRSRSRERQLKKDKRLKTKKRIETFEPTKEKGERDRYRANHSASRYDKFSKKTKR